MAIGGPSRSAEERQRDAAEAEEIRLGWRMAGLAFAVASEVAAGTILGFFADRMFGTAPLWTTVGAGLGISVSLYGLIRGAFKLNRELDQRSRRLKSATPPPTITNSTHSPDADTHSFDDDNDRDDDDRDDDIDPSPAR
jgi:F0F1-type ATP synthase assembly protein I